MTDDRDSNLTPSGSYTVGYKKPPEHSRFKPGQSGNRRGRPKDKPTERERLRKILETKITIVENGRRKRVALSEVILRQLGKKAAAGDLPATRLMFKVMEQFDIGKLSDDGRFTFIVED